MEKIKLLFVKLKDVKIIFLLTALFFGLEHYILGPFSYVQINDNLNSIAEKAFISCRSLLVGEGVSYWMPYFSGGIERLSNASGFNDIANLLFVFPPWIASALIIVIGVFLSGFFTFRLCQEILGFSKKVSVTSGILFSFTYLVESNMFYLFGMAILPFVLFYLEKIFVSHRLSLFKKIVSFFVLGIIYSFFSSLILVLPFTSVAIVLWFFLIRKQRLPYFYLALLLFFLPAGLLKFQEAWSLLANAPLSQRSSATSYLRVRLKDYVNYLPDLLRPNFIGVSLPAIITLAGFWLVKRKRLFWQMFILTFPLFLMAPLLIPLSATHAGSLLGPFRYFDFSRFSLLVPFFSAILVACILDGAQGFLGKISSSASSKEFFFKIQNLLIVFCLVAVFLSDLALKEGHFIQWVTIGSYEANTSSPDIFWMAEREKKSPPFRVASISPRAIPSMNPSLANFYGLESVDFFTNIISRRQQVFFRLMAKDERIINALYFLNTSGKDLTVDFDPSKIANMALLSLDNAKYIISDNLIDYPGLVLLPTPSAKGWQSWEKMSEVQKIKFKLAENFSGRKLLVYENKNYFSRFFLVKDVKSFASDSELLVTLATSTEKDLRNSVLLYKKDADKIISLSAAGGNIEILNYSADEMKLKVTLDGPSVLVISDNFSPFWGAKVNNERVEIMPADYVFMAVYLKEKNNEVELFYNPPYKIGAVAGKE
jgi:hypothetical protein